MLSSVLGRLKPPVTWGRDDVRLRPQRMPGGSGSGSVTSSPAPESRPLCTAAASASPSTAVPRPTLSRIAPGLQSASRSALNRCSVSGVPGKLSATRSGLRQFLRPMRSAPPHGCSSPGASGARCGARSPPQQRIRPPGIDDIAHAHAQHPLLPAMLPTKWPVGAQRCSLLVVPVGGQPSSRLSQPLPAHTLADGQTVSAGGVGHDVHFLRQHPWLQIVISPLCWTETTRWSF